MTKQDILKSINAHLDTLDVCHYIQASSLVRDANEITEWKKLAKASCESWKLAAEYTRTCLAEKIQEDLPMLNVKVGDDYGRYMNCIVITNGNRGCRNVDIWVEPNRKRLPSPNGLCYDDFSDRIEFSCYDHSGNNKQTFATIGEALDYHRSDLVELIERLPAHKKLQVS